MTIAHAKTATTSVRIAVASVEGNALHAEFCQDCRDRCGDG
jgi:hypothetical protein